MASTLALFSTRQALSALDAEGLGSSAAACHLQLALDYLEEQNDWESFSTTACDLQSALHSFEEQDDRKPSGDIARVFELVD